MNNEYFNIKDLTEKLQISNIPDELFSEAFLLDYEKNTLLMSRSMAEVFTDTDHGRKGRISLDELLNYFTAASRSVFLHDLALLKKRKQSKTDSHLDIIKDGTIANILIVMLPLETPGFILGIVHLNFDLTHEHNLQLEETIRQLRQAETVNQLILEGSTDYIYQLDLVNNVCTFSPKAVDVLPLESNTFSNAMDRLLGFIIPEDRSVFLDSFAPFLSGKSKYHRAEYRVKTKFDTVIWIRCQGKGIHDENGNPLMIAGSLIDITEQKAYEERLKNILYYDILTGLKNRNCFEKDMKKYLEDPSATGSVLCIDIHNFKIFNEIFGRDFANKILIEFTRIINLYISDNLGVYRLEGDEFLVHLAVRDRHTEAFGLLLHEHVDDEVVQRLAQHLVDLLALLGIIGVETGTRQIRHGSLLQIEHGDDLAVDHGSHIVELGGLRTGRHDQQAQQEQKNFFHDDIPPHGMS